MIFAQMNGAVGGVVVFNFLQLSKLPLALWERVGVKGACHD
jgi:hypothetical protein